MRKLGTTVFVLLFSVAVTVSTHLCVVYRHFRCPMSLFQGHVASVPKFNLPGPQEIGQNKCIYIRDQRRRTYNKGETILNTTVVWA